MSLGEIRKKMQSLKPVAAKCWQALTASLCKSKELVSDDPLSTTSATLSTAATAAEQVVTVMFVDIMGFTSFSEHAEPAKVFSELKLVCNLIRNQIVECGGIVDKTLGDGVLAFFGYRKNRSENIQNPACHARAALECAIKIQLANAQRYRENATDLVYPLRIGINTELVYLGNLGNKSIVDFTLIGNGVNAAKRLEEACDPFRVLLSRATFDLVKHDFGGQNALVCRLAFMKDHSDVTESFEYDPFRSDETIVIAALREYFKFIGRDRKEARQSVPDDYPVTVKIGGSIGRIKDFSFNGLSVEMETYYTRKVELEVYPEINDKKDMTMLKDRNIAPFVAEIRWGKSIDGKYLHGLLLKSLNEKQKQKWCSFLHKYAKDIADQEKGRK